MPLSLNVGLSRKAARDYQSRGVSINLTAEFDPVLLTQGPELQQRIAALYQQAQEAVERQLAREDHAAPTPSAPPASPAPPAARWRGRDG